MNPGDAGTTVASGKKRAHRKSRRGCQQCKQAKIKCDEEKPSCTRCVKFQAECSYLSLSSSALSLPTLVSRSSTTSPLPPSTSNLLAPLERFSIASEIGLEVNNLELLHFYTTTTSLTLSTVPEFQKIWQEVVPRIAFTHHFLLHGILAFSALHLARSQSERKTELYIEASSHHDIGLRMFQAAMTNITPDNCDACFAFSSIIAAYAWASSDQTGDLFFSDQNAPPEKSNVEWVHLLRGVYTLLIAAGEWMANGPMKSMLQPHHISHEEAIAADPEVSAKLAALSQLWESSQNMDILEKEALENALILLHDTYGLLVLSATSPDIDPITVVYGWPIQVPEAFFVMVKEQKPEALIVLAHYSLLLNKLNKFWYAKGMSRRLLKGIHNKLGKEWESWIAWPLQHLVLTEFEDRGSFA